MYVVLRPESAAERAVEEKQAPDSGKEGKNRKTKHGDDQGGGGEGGHGKEEVNVEERPLLWLIVTGKKSLPDPAERSLPNWGYVDLVTTDVQDIWDALKDEEYTTATRGKRHRPAARALGEGVYGLPHPEARRGRPRPRAHPPRLQARAPLAGAGSRAQRQRCRRRRAAGGHVEPEASFLIQIKNPEQRGGGRGGGFGGLRSKRRAPFPGHLQGRFGSNRYVPADPPDLLNYEGCELLLISASDDVEEELGLELQTETETETEQKQSTATITTATVPARRARTL